MSDRRQETCITIIINNEFTAIPLDEAARVYKRLGEILGADKQYPDGQLFNPERKGKDKD